MSENSRLSIQLSTSSAPPSIPYYGSPSRLEMLSARNSRSNSVNNISVMATNSSSMDEADTAPTDGDESKIMTHFR